ncbi:ribosome maturation factor RimP [Raineyella antarctica]|uniref:Ribosome maturation factor RimP n=1 Tax=Raineyella antarctica TaxID=1577474 RepID=A0A1G6HAQ6_9ACTN|nr:ribosome maturation factor RimP [Raineyella antarctica]SDB91233.1 ribosome maturation factor RimP [Raineyella antarctica]
MNEQRLVEIIEPVLARHELELDVLDIIPVGKRTVLRITVDGDGPQGRGPLIDDIATASRELSEALDASDVTGAGAYTLEVSSRGVNRPLSLPRHWRRNQGRLVKVTLAGGETFVARIVSSDDSGVDLVIEPEDPRPGKGVTVERRCEYTDITKARVQVEMKRQDEEED